MNLDQLDQFFQSIWTKTDDLPAALADWQLKVSDFLETDEAKSLSLQLLEDRMNAWQEVLEANREVLEKHQAKLSRELQQGEKSRIQGQQAKKFL